MVIISGARLCQCNWCGRRERLWIGLGRLNYAEDEERLLWDGTPPERILFMCGCRCIPPERDWRVIEVEEEGAGNTETQVYFINSFLYDYQAEPLNYY